MINSNKTELDKWFLEAKRGDNPLLSEWFAFVIEEDLMNDVYNEDPKRWCSITTKRIKNGITPYAIREYLVGRYSWAIPCETALSTIVKHGPIVEMGAGTGYWAHLLRSRGVDVVAYDLAPAAKSKAFINLWHGQNRCWTKVSRGCPTYLQKQSYRTLFLCWPPYDESMAADCFDNYSGDKIIYVGEGVGGCTANDEFHQKLSDTFEMIAKITLPKFSYINDCMCVLKRKNAAC